MERRKKEEKEGEGEKKKKKGEEKEKGNQPLGPMYHPMGNKFSQIKGCGPHISSDSPCPPYTEIFIPGSLTMSLT